MDDDPNHLPHPTEWGVLNPYNPRLLSPTGSHFNTILSQKIYIEKNKGKKMWRASYLTMNSKLEILYLNSPKKKAKNEGKLITDPALPSDFAIE